MHLIINENNTLFPVFILAGGLGTRLHPITKKIPKVLVDVGGEPFIEHQLRYLIKQNVTHVVLCLGYLGEMVREFIESRTWDNLKFSYVFDGDKQLGTAGAIKKALISLNHETFENFFVLYGDSYLSCDFSKVQTAYLQHQKLALMTVFKNEGRWDKSNIFFQNGQILDYNKQVQTHNMRHIDYGLGILNRKVFNSYAEDCFYDLAMVYQDLLKSNQLAGYEVSERFYEIGSFSGMSEFIAFLGS